MHMVVGRWRLSSDESARLLIARKLIVLGALLSNPVIAVFPVWAQPKEAEVWDTEFADKGAPRDAGFRGMVNGSTFNSYDKSTNRDVPVSAHAGAMAVDQHV